jgi:hypothetical protein
MLVELNKGFPEPVAPCALSSMRAARERANLSQQDGGSFEESRSKPEHRL